MIMSRRGEQVLACLDRRAVTVAFEQPLAVIEAGEVADGASELLEAVEALDPEHLLLERVDEALEAAPRLRLVMVGGRAGDAPRWSISVW